MKEGKITIADLEADILRIKEKLGYFPSIREYKESGGKYSHKPFLDRGGWNKFIVRLGGVPLKNGHDRFFEPNLNLKIYDDFFRINAHKIIATGDQHIPFHDIDLCNRLIDFNKKFRATDLLLIGDVNDMKSLYSKDIQTSHITWIQELKETKEFIKVILNYFDRVWWTAGNHCYQRMVRELNNQTVASDLINALFNEFYPRLKISDYYYCHVNETFAFNHPDSARKNKLSLEEELAKKYNMSIVNLHTHRKATGISGCGKHFIGNGLCMTDPLKQEYSCKKMTTHDKWIQGWWCVVDKKIFPYAIHDRLMTMEDVWKLQD